MSHENTRAWWGAPRKFSLKFAERKISWLELFYDLVYVVAISKITHHFAQHPDVSGFLDYTYLFIMIFWGWFNGSMYHDLHGAPGIRTRLITLWQMVSVAAMIVCLSGGGNVLFRGTIGIMVMQFYITYLWWSVGIYDKEHRRLNKPYTACYLLSFALMGATLFLQQPYVRVLFFVSLFLNYLPPFYMAASIKNSSFTLSPGMVERLGLFTIIMFGEVVTGIINGAAMQQFNFQSWFNFVLAILIVFALWWIFFSLIADRLCKQGFLKGQVMILAYIPVLMSLGMLGTGFADIFELAQTASLAESHVLYQYFTFRLAVLLFGMVLISGFLVYPASYQPAKKWLQLLLISAGIIMAVAGFLLSGLSLFSVLLLVFLLLLFIIVIITKAWVKLELGNEEAGIETQNT